jgi:hypothetical protein
MVHSVRRKRDPLHESECLSEILKFEHATQISLYDSPAIELAHPTATSCFDSLSLRCGKEPEQNRDCRNQLYIAAVQNGTHWLLTRCHNGCMLHTKGRKPDTSVP